MRHVLKSVSVLRFSHLSYSQFEVGKEGLSCVHDVKQSKSVVNARADEDPAWFNGELGNEARLQTA